MVKEFGTKSEIFLDFDISSCEKSVKYLMYAMILILQTPEEHLPTIYGSSWISNECYLSTNMKKSSTLVIIEPETDAIELKYAKVDIMFDSVRIWGYNSDGYYDVIEVPIISTEEELFQQSLLHNLSDFPLQFFTASRMVIEKLWNITTLRNPVRSTY